MGFLLLAQKNNTNKKNYRIFAFCIITFFACTHASTTSDAKMATAQNAQNAQTAQTRAQSFPEINFLNTRDPLFKQYSQDVEQTYKLLARGLNAELIIYRYNCTEKDTIITIAARCNIPQDTIATLNHFSSADVNLKDKSILLPTVPGLFITTKPTTTLEHILTKKNFDIAKSLCYTINEEQFYFLPQERFAPTERAFFLDTALTSPLPQGVLTSSYGMRISPITGIEQFHGGTDLAAPVGTDVLAARQGVVEYTGKDRIYGNYIVIKHENRTQSLYAHLSEIKAKTGERVERGCVIGKVGVTGLTTGPHLHFEIRIDGKSQQPPNSLFFNKKY